MCLYGSDNIKIHTVREEGLEDEMIRECEQGR